MAVEHSGLYPYLSAYLETLRLRNASEQSVVRRDSNLRRLMAWCDDRGIDQPQEVTKPVLESYQRYLYYYRQPSGEPLSPTTQNHYLGSVKQWFKWLTQQNYLLYNPASELVLPKVVPSLPVVLSIEEVECLLDQPDTETDHGIRTRAMLELLYSTGLRRSELCRLDESQ